MIKPGRPRDLVIDALRGGVGNAVAR